MPDVSNSSQSLRLEEFQLPLVNKNRSLCAEFLGSLAPGCHHPFGEGGYATKAFARQARDGDNTTNMIGPTGSLKLTVVRAGQQSSLSVWFMFHVMLISSTARGILPKTERLKNGHCIHIHRTRSSIHLHRLLYYLKLRYRLSLLVQYHLRSRTYAWTQ